MRSSTDLKFNMSFIHWIKPYANNVLNVKSLLIKELYIMKNVKGKYSSLNIALGMWIYYCCLPSASGTVNDGTRATNSASSGCSS